MSFIVFIVYRYVDELCFVFLYLQSSAVNTLQGDRFLSKPSVITTFHGGEWGGELITSTLNLTVDISHVGESMSCIPVFNGKELEDRTATHRLNITDEPPGIFLVSEAMKPTLEWRNTSITCQTHRAIIPPNITWTIGGKALGTGGEKYLVRSELGVGNRIISTLTVNVSREDNQQDVACSLNDQDVSAGTLINVVFAPEHAMLKSNQPEYAAIGSELTLTCVSESSNPPPIITWYPPYDTVIKDEVGARNGVSRSSTISEMVLLGDDGKTYTCVVTYENTTVSILSHQVHLAKLPRVEITGVEDPTREGRTLSFHCGTENGLPGEFTYNWTFEPRLHTYPPEKLGQTATLEIALVSYTHAGIYVCQVTNLAGTVSERKELLVEYEPKSLNSSSPGTVKVTVGDRLDISLQIAAYPEPHSTSLGMVSESGIINPADDFDVRLMSTVNDSYAVVVSIGEVKSGHLGKYTCTVENDIGSLTLHFILDRQTAAFSLVLVIGAGVCGVVFLGIIISVVVVVVLVKMGRIRLKKTSDGGVSITENIGHGMSVDRFESGRELEVTQIHEDPAVYEDVNGSNFNAYKSAQREYASLGERVEAPPPVYDEYQKQESDVDKKETDYYNLGGAQYANVH